MEKRRSYIEPSGTLSRSSSRQSVSTRMKKVAPPPPSVPSDKALVPPLSNGNLVRRSISAEPHPKPPRTPLHHVRSAPGEDSAIDELLEGRMDLQIVLPDCKVVRMTVDRKTPMMDLLVQATTSNKISPSDHIINLISKGEQRNVHYKPNTPIGALDANTVYIIPKSTLELPVKRMPKLANQPFEQTFRLQVNLPHNQRMVLRVSPRITLDELKHQICSEKELDFSSHHLVHPAHPDTILDLNATLDVYGCAEISLMSNAGLRDSIRNTATYFVQPPRLEEEKKKKGILRLFSRRKRDFNPETSSNGVNHIPSSQSDGATLNRNSYQPKQSIKRKPAPAPPPSQNSSPPLITKSSNSINSRPESEISVKTADDIESSVSHSRHSSDSSGYHEPSVFSDCSENKSPEASIVHGDHGYVSDVHRQDSPLQKDNFENTVQMKRSSMSTRESNLKNVPSCSNISISSASRKRKAPQPPMSTLPAIESPTTPDATLVDSITNQSIESKACEAQLQEKASPDVSVKEDSSAAVETVKHVVDCKQQESEALQYLEDVLQESEKLPSPKILDDSDTDSLKDEGQVISVCQAEVHANANDHDSPDSIADSQTVVASASESQKCSFAPLPNPTQTQSTGCEEFAAPELVPSETELPVQNSSIVEIVNIQNSESSACDDATLKSPDEKPDKEIEHLTANEKACTPETKEPSAAGKSIILEDPPTAPSAESEQECKTKKVEKVIGDKSSASSISSGSHQNSTTVTPQCRKKLDNFVLSSYKKDEIEDIYSLPTDSNSSERSCLVNNTFVKPEVEVPKRKLKSQPDVKIVSLKEKASVDVLVVEENNSGSVPAKCEQLSKMSTLPLNGRCSSMYNLTPQKKVQAFHSEGHEETVIEENLKRTQSEQNFANDLQPVDLKACFLQEQKRLQEEYQRLQEQFISWQKQLMNNQSLLQNENILPQMPFTSLAGLDSIEKSIKTVSENQLNSRDESVPSDLKTRSLPRPNKTKTLSLKDSTRPKTPPIPTETAVVDIDIGTEVAKRPDSLTSCSVNTQADVSLEDKVTQVPSPQDKVTQVPSPQEKVTSGTQVPSPETVKSKEDVSAQTSNQNLASPTESTSSESEASKSQTLPRPKPKPISAFQPSQTMTLNRKSMPKPAVTIGSWQQRQSAAKDIEPSNVASSRSKFQSLEHIPQTSIKSVPSFMEKRKLPPVPTEETSVKEVHAIKSKSADSSTENKFSNTIIKESTKPSGKTVNKGQNILSDETAVKTVATTSKTSAPVSRHDESVVQQKTEIKVAAKEPSTLFRSVKPFIKMSSMKDESHTPSIIGLRKWPLSDISESKTIEGRQSIVEDLKASSKRPGGFVQETIRRAEVDLRKPRSSKTQSTPATKTTAKTKTDSAEPNKPKPPKITETTSEETQVKEATTVQPSKLHITKVSITSVKSSNNGPKPYEKKHTSNVTTPVTAPSSGAWANTIPKSFSLNSELLAAFNKKANKDTERYKEIGTAKTTPDEVQVIKVNGSVQPPPPPPPVQCTSSVMPTIPPAEQIPVSSQLLMAKGTTTVSVTKKKESKKSPTKFSRTADPREELMLEIRSFGGKQALRKLYEKSCLNLLKKSPKKKSSSEESSSSKLK